MNMHLIGKTFNTKCVNVKWYERESLERNELVSSFLKGVVQGCDRLCKSGADMLSLRSAYSNAQYNTGKIKQVNFIFII